MREEVFHQPDEALMWKALADNALNIAGVILQLAWREGLTRAEIHKLEWTQVDYENRRLRLPDRDVPLEDGAAPYLRQWRALFGARQPVYAAVSLKTGKRIAEQYISRVAREALDGVGLNDVRLVDLRHDFVRRMLEKYDWTYAIRVSGLSVTTYRNAFTGERKRGLPTVPDRPSAESAGELLWRVMEENQSSPAGVALWLWQQANMPLREIAGLTWDQIDLEKGRVTTEGGDFLLTKEFIQILAAEKARRGAADDPHVLLTPRSRKPMDKSRLSTLIRDLLLRNGLDGAADGLRYADRARGEKERILRQARAAGSITRREVETMLGVKANVAYSRLAELVESGDLVLSGRDYVPAEIAAPQEQDIV